MCTQKRPHQRARFHHHSPPANSRRLIVKVLRVIRLCEEEPAFSQQAHVLHQRRRDQQGKQVVRPANYHQCDWHDKYRNQEKHLNGLQKRRALVVEKLTGIERTAHCPLRDLGDFRVTHPNRSASRALTLDTPIAAQRQHACTKAQQGKYHRPQCIRIHQGAAVVSRQRGCQHKARSQPQQGVIDNGQR